MDAHDTRPWEAYHEQLIDGRSWSAYGASRTGSNHASNEDSYLIAPLPHDRLLVAVADGLGGHNAGRIASRQACETLYDCAHNGTLDALDDSDDSILHLLEAAVLEAHGRIAMWSKEITAFDGMGCTLTVTIIARKRAWYCHVGDSRLYQIGNTTCLQITDDQIVKRASPSEVRSHFHEDDDHRGALLTQALGIEESNNRLQMQQGAISLDGGNVLLVCSDGLYNCLEDEHLADIVHTDLALATQVNGLIDAAVSAGSSDDITAVLVATTVDFADSA